MRKKLWVTAIIIFGACLGGGLFLSFFKADTGIYIQADEPIIVFHEGPGEPVVMRSRKGSGEEFGKLRTGDKILILHNGTMMLSYPAQINVYFCIRLKKGDVSDVPESVLDSLVEMGWFSGGGLGQDQ